MNDQYSSSIMSSDGCEKTDMVMVGSTVYKIETVIVSNEEANFYHKLDWSNTNDTEILVVKI